jgi:phasin
MVRLEPKLWLTEEREAAMDDNKAFEIPKDMRSMAEASFSQARNAFENFLSAAQRTASTFEGQGEAARASAREISNRAVSFAEKNVAASLDYAEKLLKANSVAELMRLHSDYVQAQMRSLAEQASEMGQVVTKAAMDAASKSPLPK